MEEWNSVGITENGFAAAKELGGSLVRNAKISRATVYGWGLRRCVETAAAIALGLGDEGAIVRSMGNLDLKGPISDHSVYDDMIRTGRMQEMLDSWQRAEDVKRSLIPIAEYGPMVFRAILDQATSRRDELTLVVTHDMHILPLASHAMRTTVDLPDYLDGLVIGSMGRKISVGYGQMEKSTDLGTLTR